MSPGGTIWENFCLQGNLRGPKSKKELFGEIFLSDKLYTKRLKEARKSMKNANIRSHLWSFKSTSLHLYLDIAVVSRRNYLRKFLFAIEVTGDQNLKKEPFGEIFLSQKLYTMRSKEARKSMKNANIRSLLWSFKSTSLRLDIGSCLQEELFGKISVCKET